MFKIIAGDQGEHQNILYYICHHFYVIIKYSLPGDENAK